jgi:hypothetical protein
MSFSMQPSEYDLYGQVCLDLSSQQHEFLAKLHKLDLLKKVCNKIMSITPNYIPNDWATGDREILLSRVADRVFFAKEVADLTTELFEDLENRFSEADKQLLAHVGSVVQSVYEQYLLNYQSDRRRVLKKCL